MPATGRGDDLATAIDAAVGRWMGWRIGRRTSRETGIPEGLPHLTGLVADCAIAAECRPDDRPCLRPAALLRDARLGVVAAPGWSRPADRRTPMPKLSDTQSILLTAAAQRADGNLLPLPGSLRGGAATKVVAALLARGLAEEQTVESTAKADPALNTLWRNADDGRGILLRITPAGLDALGIEAGSVAVAAAAAARSGRAD